MGASMLVVAVGTERMEDEDGDEDGGAHDAAGIAFSSCSFVMDAHVAGCSAKCAHKVPSAGRGGAGICEFAVPERYALHATTLGKGAQGMVVQALDTLSGTQVAVKRVADVFSNKYTARSAVRELWLLSRLRHENVIGLVDAFAASCPPPILNTRRAMDRRRGERVVDLYLVTELMDYDLRQLVHSDFQIELPHARFVLLQILSAVEYLHSEGCVHMDLKPANILLNCDWDAKVADFGSARVLPSQDSKFRPSSVVSRFYQPPEALLRDLCDNSVDIWAVGCIFAELLLRRPLFDGATTSEQLAKIVSILGNPALDDLAHLSNAESVRYLQTRPDSRPKYRSELLDALEGDTDGLDLLLRMLHFNPKKRLSASEALVHKFFSKHNVEELDFEFGDVERPNVESISPCDLQADGSSVKRFVEQMPAAKKGRFSLPDATGTDSEVSVDQGQWPEEISSLRRILSTELEPFDRLNKRHAVHRRPCSVVGPVPSVLIGSLTSSVQTNCHPRGAVSPQ